MQVSRSYKTTMAARQDYEILFRVHAILFHYMEIAKKMPRS